MGLLEIITEWKPVAESEPDKTESNAGEGRKLCWRGSASPEFLSVKRFGTCAISVFQPTWLGVGFSLFPSARAAEPNSFSASNSLAGCTLSYWVKNYAQQSVTGRNIHRISLWTKPLIWTEPWLVQSPVNRLAWQSTFCGACSLLGFL